MAGPLAHGLRGARRRAGLVLLVYLSTLAPALLALAPAAGPLAAGLGHSRFAARALAGDRFGVWEDLGNDPRTAPSFAGLRAALPTALLLQILLAAGVVEALLGRERRGEHPFLLGIGRHGWRFARASVWFAGALVVLAALAAVATRAVNQAAAAASDGRLQIAGWALVALAVVLVFAPLELAHDLSRVAAAAHGEGRTLVGFVRALGHALRHPLRLAPLWIVFALPLAALGVAYLAGRAAWGPSGAGGVALLIAAQQLVFLVVAFLRVGFWGAEIAYYQALGEPHWCGRRPPAVAAVEGPAPAAPAAEAPALAPAVE